MSVSNRHLSETDFALFQVNTYLEVMQEKERKVSSLVQKLEEKKIEVKWLIYSSRLNDLELSAFLLIRSDCSRC